MNINTTTPFPNESPSSHKKIVASKVDFVLKPDFTIIDRDGSYVDSNGKYYTAADAIDYKLEYGPIESVAVNPTEEIKFTYFQKLCRKCFELLMGSFAWLVFFWLLLFTLKVSYYSFTWAFYW